MREAVILIPGFFGFGNLGGAHTLEYFHDVSRVLVAAEPRLAGRILVHSPSPAGSLDERAASLHEIVKHVLAGTPYRDNPAVQADRIHLIGHSAGGVDARLYANPEFVWEGGPEREERTEPLAHLGQVVTVSAPHAGTPIADGDLPRDLFMMAVYLAAVFQRGWQGAPHGGARELARRLARWVQDGATLDLAAKLFAGLDDRGAAELRGFTDELLHNRQLLPDLTPASMQSRTAGLRATDHRDIHCYVSVAPPPSVWPPTDLPWRAAYAFVYRATMGTGGPGPFPSGPELAGDVAARRGDPSPSDGVVPASSQTLDGSAAGIVEADHADVIGHYDGGGGGTIFKSDARFDEGRLRTLWGDIARRLV